MRPGGGTRSTYAHSTNMRKLTRNAHISYNFDEDENSLFVPELPQSLQDEVKALKRKRRRSNSTNDQAAADDCEAMFAPVPDEEDSAAALDAREVSADPESKQQDHHGASISSEAADPSPAPATQTLIKDSVSKEVAARIAAIRASRTPQPRQQGTPATEIPSARAGKRVRTSSVSSVLGSPMADTGSPTASALDLKRAELARVQAARAAVNEKNEAMLQAIEAANAKKALAEAREVERVEREIAVENEKLEIAKRHAEEIRAHGLDVENEQGGEDEAVVKLEIEE